MEGMRLLSNYPLSSPISERSVGGKNADVEERMFPTLLGRATSSRHSISLVWFSVGMHGDAGAVVVYHVLDDHEL